MKKLILSLSFFAFQYSFGQWTTNGTHIYNTNSGNVGIGITSPAGPLHVYGGNAVVWGLNVGFGTSPAVITTDDNTKGLSFRIAGTEYFRLHNNGNVGIGTSSPTAKLSVVNPISTNVVATLGLFGYSESTSNRSMSFQQIGNASTAHQYLFLNGGLGSSSVVGTPTLTSSFAPSFGFECNDNNLNIITSSSGTNVTVKRAMSVSSNGNVGIGTTSVNDVNYKLFVETGIRTRKVKVDVAGWADYVFSSSYKLPTLKEVEEFIKQYKHLPDVLSEGEVKKEGLDIGENQVVLLKKIEELTLYIIEQNKKNEEQQKEIEKLKEENCRNGELKKEIENIKKLLSSQNHSKL